MKPIRLIELFAGIGSQAKALKSIGADFETYRVVEFDKYAIKSYNAVHGTNFETSDITEITGADLGIIDTDKYNYILTYSFPCQDLSVAGLQAGMDKGSGTRSGLLWEVERLLNECDELPQVLLMENVTQVHGKKNKENFNKWCEYLESRGYKNFWQDLNAKNYGIPQNRNRCFMVSILNDAEYIFPQPFELKLRLKDMLEDNADERYYLNDSALKTYNRDFGSKGKLQQADGICSTLLMSMGGGGGNTPIINVKEATKKGYAEATTGDSINLEQPNSKTRRGRVGHGVAQTLTTSPQQAVLEPTICASRGRYDKSGKIKQHIEINQNGCSNALTSVQKDNYVIEPMDKYYLSNKGKNFVLASKRGMTTDINKDVCQPLTAKGQQNWTGSFVSPDIEKLEKSSTIGNNEPVKIYLKDGNIINSENEEAIKNLRIRKLTPLECWRLMGFDDADFYNAEKVNSNTQLYKQAGNSICVPVLEKMFENLLPILE